jgi:hypothetical protein
MPHYKDGTPAEVGDFVKGKPYNTGHEIVGTVVQITEGTDSCNCIVAFAEAALTDLPLAKFYDAGFSVPAYIRRPVGGRVRERGGMDPQQTEDVMIRAKLDYCALKDFVKV